MIIPKPERRVEGFVSLTDKQREVLDLLIEHKTSKEIARELGISPHTVEQRLRYAKHKLNVSRRSDLASTYRRLRATCEEIAYEDLDLDSLVNHFNPNGGTSAQPSVAIAGLSGPFKGQSANETASEMARIVPAMFEGRTGTWMRIGAIFVIAFCIIVTGLAGLAVFEQLSKLLA